MNVRKLVITLATVVSVTTFVLLYGGLYELALIIGMERWQAFLFPIAIDATTLVPLIATLDKRVNGINHVFVWAFTAVSSAVSVWSQWLVHPPTAEAPWAPYVAAWPAVSLILISHVLWIVAQDGLVEKEVREVVEEHEAVLSVVPDAPRETPVDLTEAVRVLTAAKAMGMKITPRDMAEKLGLLDEDGKPTYHKGYYWLRRAEEVAAA